MKKHILEKLITITILLSYSTAYALTAQEAEQKYRDLKCHRVESTDPTCDSVICDVVDEIVKMSVIEWDGIVPTPTPKPEPLPEPIPEPLPAPTPEGCIATWCSLPIQKCSLPPLTGGTDSCGNPCSKPSTEWPNCIAD